MDKLLGSLFGIEVWGNTEIGIDMADLPTLVGAARTVIDDARANDRTLARLWTDGRIVVGEIMRTPPPSLPAA